MNQDAGKRQTDHRELVNGLTDMLQGGRLREADIPDDYRWLVDALSRLRDD